MRRWLAPLCALGLAIAAGAAAATASEVVFERMPHLEDEFALLWEASVMAQGTIALPSPPEPNSILVPFVVDYQGLRFGKYPPGWPAALSLGVRAGDPWLLNALLALAAVWLIYRLGEKVAGQAVGLLAALLAACSPMTLMLSATLMSHTFSLFLVLALTLAWLDLFPRAGRKPSSVPAWLLVAVAGLSPGLLALTRPLTALGAALPLGLHGLWLLARAGRAARRRVLAVGALALAVAALLPLWQWALTGDPWLNPYTLWWPYDHIGFGPGIGRAEGGHSLTWAWINTRFSLRAGMHDLFGWPHLSWLFLPFGLWALRWDRDAWLVLAAFPGLVLIYAAYWIGAWLFGPRYYYEALPGLAVISAAGICWLAGWASTRGSAAGRTQEEVSGRAWGARMAVSGAARLLGRLRRPAVGALVLTLLTLNALFYLPIRLGGMRGLYGMSRAAQRPFEKVDLGPVLIIVHPIKHWSEYGTLITLEPPFSESDLLFALSRGREQNERVAAAFPGRRVYHYYPDDRLKLYPEPRQ